jgi:hypothetical protein
LGSFVFILQVGLIDFDPQYQLSTAALDIVVHDAFHQVTGKDHLGAWLHLDPDSVLGR